MSNNTCVLSVKSGQGSGTGVWWGLRSGGRSLRY